MLRLGRRATAGLPVGVELPEPTAVLGDWAVDTRQRRPIAIDLVLPDGNVLGELQVCDLIVEFRYGRGKGFVLEGLHGELDDDLRRLAVYWGLGDVGEHLDWSFSHLHCDDPWSAGRRDCAHLVAFVGYGRHLDVLVDNHPRTLEGDLEPIIVGRRHVVHCQEVRPVDDVFGEVLKADPDPVGVHPPRRPLCAVISIQGHLVLRAHAAGVGPDEDPAVALSDVPRAGRHPRRLAVETWDLHQPALAVEAPSVEWADDAVVTDATTEAQMGAQMWAVGVEDPRQVVLTPERDEL